MVNWEGTRQEWETRLSATRLWARLAVGALALTAAVRTCGGIVTATRDFTSRGWEDVALAEQSAVSVLLVLTAVAFLVWLSRAISLAAQVSPGPIQWTSSRAVWSFFIPILGLYRPYQVLRDLHDQLAPHGVPEPAPRPRMDGAGGYRSVAMEARPLPRTLPHASIGAWWALFVAQRILPSMLLLTSVTAVAAALLAVLVVRAVQGRLEERLRRVRHASDEELEEWAIPG